MLKDLSFDEIQTYFKGLDTKVNGSLSKARLYGMAQKTEEQVEKENQIANTYGDKENQRHIMKVLIIDNDLSIIEAKEKWDNEVHIMYYPVVKMRNLNYAFETLDEAIIYGIANKNKNDKYANAAIKLIAR